LGEVVESIVQGGERGLFGDLNGIWDIKYGAVDMDKLVMLS